MTLNLNKEISVKPGDYVQIKSGSIDITNNRSILEGDLYVEKSPNFGIVEAVIPNYKTHGKFGFPETVTAVKIRNSAGIVMYTVQEQNIAKDHIKASNTEMAFTVLSPISGIINSQALSAGGAILNEVANIMGPTSALPVSGIPQLRTAWADAMQFDRKVTEAWNNAKGIYETIASLLFGAKKTDKRKEIGVLGAAKEIQNYIRVTQLFGIGENYDGTWLDKLLGYYNSFSSIYNSAKLMIGSYASSSGAGAASIDTDLPSYTGTGTFRIKTENPSTITRTNISVPEQSIEYEIKALSADQAKLVGSSKAMLDQMAGSTYSALANMPKPPTNTVATLGEDVTNVRFPTDDEIRNIGIMDSRGLTIATNLFEYKAPTVPELMPDVLVNESPATVYHQLNEHGDPQDIRVNLVQNAYGYPQRIGKRTEKNDFERNTTGKVHRYANVQYDYKIRLDDYPSPSGQSLEDQLMKARTALGIQVHGSKNLARAIEYFLYNRYGTFDGGPLAFHKMPTHVFFTRPDLNLLYNGAIDQGPNTILPDIKDFTDAFLIWQRNPNLFRLLTDCNRTGELEPNNFNMLLSRRVTNFQFKGEEIELMESSPNWKDYKINYGGSYKGRGNGSFNCTFLETSDLAITDLMKLWTMYIDNVTLGVWKPSYNLQRSKNNDVKVSIKSPYDSHIYTRTLDYASSCYCFKMAPDGEDILYWTKYYGVFPRSFSLEHLNYTKGAPPGEAITINVEFAYSFKKDLSPISLLEFNKVSNIKDADGSKTIFESNFNRMFDQKNSSGEIVSPAGIGSGVPLVGAPFIVIRSVRDSIKDTKSFLGLVEEDTSPFKLLLKFKPVPNSSNNLGSDHKVSDSTFDYDKIYKPIMAQDPNTLGGMLLKDLQKSITDTNALAPNPKPDNTLTISGSTQSVSGEGNTSGSVSGSVV